MKHYLLMIALFSNILAFAQREKALEYYKLCNKAELAICDSNIVGALEFYQCAFSINPSKPFSRDLNNAYNCAIDIQDFDAAEKYFKKLSSRGILKNHLKYFMFGTDSTKVLNWLKRYPNDTSKYQHPIRSECSKMLIADQAVRRYFISLNEDGNYMTDSVYKVDSINALSLFTLFSKYGNSLPDEDLIGSFYGDPPYRTILIHHLGPKRVKGCLFDSMMYKGIFNFSISPSVYSPLAEMKFDKKSYCFKEECLQFPLSIFIAKYEDSLFPEYLAPDVEQKMNLERAKIGLCTVAELRKKVKFLDYHRLHQSFLSKYIFDTDIAGYLEASSLEEVLEWDLKNEPYKPQK